MSLATLNIDLPKVECKGLFRRGDEHDRVAGVLPDCPVV